MKKIQAIILAGGKGSRLRPYTTILPKPLLPVGDLSIAEIIICQLKTSGIKNIVISTGYLSSLIQAYFGNGSKWGVNITYVHETSPLGTAGAIRLVNNLDENFLVINGDILTTVNFKKLLSEHTRNKGLASIIIKERSVKTDFGIIEVENNKLKNYIEKPEHKSFVSTGINIFFKEVVKYIKDEESIGMPELMLRIKNAGEDVYCIKTKAKWFDLGRVEDLESAQEIFNKDRKLFINE